MSGMELSKMEVSDMLDVIHVIFEDENSYDSEDQMKSRLKMREILYESLYQQPFQYKYVEPKKTGSNSYGSFDEPDELLEAPRTQDFSNLDGTEGLKPFNPRKNSTQRKVQNIEDIDAKPFDPGQFSGTFLEGPLG
jgi:hypothetical protein